MKKISVIALALTMIIVGAACSNATPADAQTSGKTTILTIGTADTGGTMYPVGCTIAKVINDNVEGVKVNAETSAGSPANTVNLQAGEIDLAMIAGDVAYQAYTGTGKFEGKACADIRAIAACYPSLSNWIALDSSNLKYVEDLEGKKLAIGPSASATAIAANAAIEATGVTPSAAEYLGLTEGADSVGDGVHDAAHAFAGIPVGGFLNMTNIKAAHLLAYKEETLDKIIAANGSYYKAVIPAGTYNDQVEDVPTFGVKCLVTVNASMDDELVKKMTEALQTHPDDLVAGHAAMTAMTDTDFMCNDLPIPLHPGAEAYYKDAGFIK
ncbi:MAG: TAXI family TRAP transporter solute-binding subunit [Candidatus Fimivivens sp.]